jgi:hypothetical protein
VIENQNTIKSFRLHRLEDRRPIAEFFPRGLRIEGASQSAIFADDFTAAVQLRRPMRAAEVGKVVGQGLFGIGDHVHLHRFGLRRKPRPKAGLPLWMFQRSVRDDVVRTTIGLVLKELQIERSLEAGIGQFDGVVDQAGAFRHVLPCTA